MNLSPEIKKQYFNTPQMEAMYRCQYHCYSRWASPGKIPRFRGPFSSPEHETHAGQLRRGSRDFLSATVDPYTPWYAERSPAMEHTARCTLLHRPKAPFIRQFQGTGYSSGQL